jgi:hypothetical protein
MDHQVQIVRPFSANRRQQYNIQRFMFAAILVEMIVGGVVSWMNASFADEVLTVVQWLCGLEV